MENIINYTDHSIGLSTIRVDDVLNNALDKGLKSAFIVEDSTMASAPYFFQQCEKKGIKPIYGVKVNIEEGGSLIFYAKTLSGYKSISNLISRLEKFEIGKKRKLPLVEISDFLENSSGGVFCVDGYKGSFLDHCANNSLNTVYGSIIRRFKRDDFAFIYDQNSSPKINDIILKMSKRFDFKKISTTESFYTNSSDFSAFYGIYKKSGYARGADAASLNDFKIGFNSLKNKLIQDVGNSFFSYDDFSSIFDNYKISNPVQFINVSNPGSLREKIRSLWLEKRDEVPLRERKKYEERIRYELDVIESLDGVFEQYFMFFSQLSEAAKERDVKNAIRGSAVGSYVLHLLGLSSVDPVKYNLSFERFIFKGISEYPDIDLDVSDKDKMLSYLSDKYGENMAQISVFSSVKKITETAALIVDAEKEKNNFGLGDSGLTNEDLDLILEKIKLLSKKIYSSDNTASFLLKNNKKWKVEYDGDAGLKFILDKAIALENIFKNRSNSPSSSIVSNERISNIIPVNDGIAEVTSEHCEYLGFLKIDLLSSKMLARINNIEKIISWDYETPLDQFISNENNMKTLYSYISAGLTTGVNQIGGDIGKYICKSVKPESFSDLMVVLGLIRMGVNENMKEFPEEYLKFLNGKNNRSYVVYAHDDLKEILEETYGSIIYEEQIMEIVKKFGSFDNNEANKFRKCITKTKNIDTLKEFRKVFFERGEKNGYSFDVLKSVFDSLQEKMNQFNFSKNHSASYAMITLKEMFLKVTYPAEFITVYGTKDNKVDVSDLYNEYLNMGYVFLPPSILSLGDIGKTVDRYVSGKKIRTASVGFSSILENKSIIPAMRKQDKIMKFSGIVDFVDRIFPYCMGENSSILSISDNVVNGFKSDLSKLIKIGFFDSLYDSVISREGDKEYKSLTREEKVMVIRGSLLKYSDSIVDSYLSINDDNDLVIDFDYALKNDSIYKYIGHEISLLNISSTNSIMQKKSRNKRHP